jgi:hypothetical protein
MKKLPKEKRNQVILVWLVTLGVLAAGGFVVLRAQLDAKSRAASNLEARKSQYKHMTELLEGKEALEQKAAAASQDLAKLEYQMADSVDVFSWAINTLRDFNQSRNVDIPQKSQPVSGANTLLPDFPYNEARLTVAGTAFFQDLGLFLADFENKFPFARITNVDIQPATSGDEKLSFRMDIIFLLKPKETAG